MEMIFNHMPAEYYADKKISANAKLVLQRLFTLSKDGTQSIYAKRKFLANELGLSVRTISNVFKELETENYIQETENTNSFDRTRNFILTCKSCKIDTKKEEKVARIKGKSCKGGIAKVATSSLDRNKARNKREDLSLSFDSIFSAMNEIKNEFTDYVFSDEEIRENAQSYLDKSQGYKFYKGKPTEAKIKAWLQKSTEYLQNKPQGGNKTSQIVEHGFEIDFEGAAERLDKFKQFLEENNNPIDVDCNVIDELENKNTSA